jgi:hypothetical protein
VNEKLINEKGIILFNNKNGIANIKLSDKVIA